MQEFRNKKISSNVTDMLEWIGDASELIRTRMPLMLKSTTNEGERGAVTVKNHRVSYPADCVELYAVEYQGYSLPKGREISGYGLPNAERTTNIRLGSQAFSGLIYLDGTPVTEADFARLPVFNGDYYLINGPYIQTSFEEGHIKLHYGMFPVDDCGFPMIPDKSFYKKALVWYVIMMLLAQGYSHPVYTWELAERRWEEFMPRAQNELKAPGLADMETFRNMWTRLIPAVTLPQDFFAGSEQMQMIDL